MFKYVIAIFLLFFVSVVSAELAILKITASILYFVIFAYGVYLGSHLFHKKWLKFFVWIKNAFRS